MDFNIIQNSTLNPLKVELIQDGRNNYDKFFELIQNANIYFSMVDVDDGTIKISKQPACCMLKTEVPLDAKEEYYIIYNWRSKDTCRPGTYQGQFFIEFLNEGNKVENTLIVPIQEILYIHVLDGLIKKSY
jgi:hypothetical protein